MARLTDDEWEELRIEHEVKGVLFSELALKSSVNRSSISRRAKRDGWNKDETQQTINAIIKNKKKIIELENQTQQTQQICNPSKAKINAINEVVDYKIKMEEVQSETGYVVARINKIAARKLEKRMDDESTTLEEEANIIDKVSVIAGIYQKLQKSEPKTVINQKTNTMNVTLEERKQELMNILSAYD